MSRPSARPDLASAVRGRRILVVEDEYMLAEDLRQQLEEVGAVVLGPVPSVAAALAMLAQDAPLPDAAILDVNLGGEMVFPVAETLRDQGVPFVFATGYDAWSLSPAFADIVCFEKPFDVGRCLKRLFG